MIRIDRQNIYGGNNLTESELSKIFISFLIDSPLPDTEYKKQVLSLYDGLKSNPLQNASDVRIKLNNLRTNNVIQFLDKLFEELTQQTDKEGEKYSETETERAYDCLVKILLKINEKESGIKNYRNNRKIINNLESDLRVTKKELFECNEEKYSSEINKFDEIFQRHVSEIRNLKSVIDQLNQISKDEKIEIERISKIKLANQPEIMREIERINYQFGKCIAEKDLLTEKIEQTRSELEGDFTKLESTRRLLEVSKANVKMEENKNKALVSENKYLLNRIEEVEKEIYQLKINTPPPPVAPVAPIYQNTNLSEFYSREIDSLIDRLKNKQRK